MTITGLDRLKFKLTKKLPAAIDRQIKRVLEQNADEVLALMRSFCISKTVAASINWTWGAAPKGSMVLARSEPKPGSRLRITIYAGDETTMVGSREQFQLARLIEFGTQPHINEGLYAGSQHPGTKAQPFFFPGWRIVRKRVKGRISRGIKKAIKEASAS